MWYILSFLQNIYITIWALTIPTWWILNRWQVYYLNTIKWARFLHHLHHLLRKRRNWLIYGLFHDDEDIVIQKKDLKTGSNVSGNDIITGGNVDDDGDDDDDDYVLDVDDNETSANVGEDHQEF